MFNLKLSTFNSTSYKFQTISNYLSSSYVLFEMCLLGICYRKHIIKHI